MTTLSQWSRPALERRVREVIAKSLHEDPGTVIMGARLVEGLDVGPTDLLDIMHELGKAFGLTIIKADYVALLTPGPEAVRMMQADTSPGRREAIFDRHPDYFMSPTVGDICTALEKRLAGD